jgi:hypothetical protein
MIFGTELAIGRERIKVKIAVFWIWAVIQVMAKIPIRY